MIHGEKLTGKGSLDFEVVEGSAFFANVGGDAVVGGADGFFIREVTAEVDDDPWWVLRGKLPGFQLIDQGGDELAPAPFVLIFCFFIEYGVFREEGAVDGELDATYEGCSIAELNGAFPGQSDGAVDVFKRNGLSGGVFGVYR